MQENRRIYSLNLISYLTKRGVLLNLDVNADGKLFATCKNDITYLIEEYRNDKELQSFLHSYKIIRDKIKELKIQQ